MYKKLFLLNSLVLVLCIAGSASADYPLNTAVAVWHLDDEFDENGPPFANIDTGTMGSDFIEVTGAEGAPHWDGWGLGSDVMSWTYWDPPDPVYDELLPEGAVSILVRVKMAEWANNIEVITGVYDGDCGDSVPSYGIEFHNSGKPTFAVTQAGMRVRSMVSLPEAVELDTWYDIFGVFDPDRDRIRVIVLDPVRGSKIGSAEETVDFDSLDYPGGPEYEIFVSPCTIEGAIVGGFVELIAVWAEVIDPLKAAVSNPSPTNGAGNVRTDTNLCFKPPYNAICMNPDADPNLKGPFDFTVYFSSDPCNLAWIPPTIGPIDSNELICVDPCATKLLAGTPYYWRVDVNDLNEPGEPCLYEGPVFGFTTRGSCEGWGCFQGDMDGDCFVNFVDYSEWATAWGSQQGDDEYDPNCDINAGGPDGFIDVNDFDVLVGKWLMQIGPAAPNGLTFGNVTPVSIGVSWTDNSTEEDGFNIYINTSPNQPADPNYINVEDDTTLIVTGLEHETTYYFWVTAYNLLYGESPIMTGNETTTTPTGGGPLIEPGEFLYRDDLSVNPALRPGSGGEWDDNYIESGDMVKVGDTYYWYYHGHDGSSYQVGVATATDPSEPWTKYAGNPVIPRGPGNYDDVHTACAAFYEEAGTYYLFYWSAGSGYNNAIAFATATDPIGPWTKYAGNPILGDDEDELGFTAGKTYLCGVMKVDDTYYLYVTDADATQGDYGPMYLFTASSIYGPWTRNPDPVLSPGAAGEWDEGAFSEAEVLYYDGMFHTFYGACMLNSGRTESVGYAYSYDGFAFTKYEENPVIDRLDIEHDPNVSALAEVHFEIEMPYIYIVSTERWEEDWDDHTGCPWCEDLAIQVIEILPEDVYPASDPTNTGNWVLRADMSDEFEGSSLDTDKWFASGTGGVFMYSWPGRAPSQFAPENIRVEDGKLKLTTKWDPNYPFVPDIDPDCGCPYENYTTAAVISNNTFQYGYMEIKCKAADVSITSSFWATGDSSELDVFEFVADSKVYDNDRTYPFCVHDWDHGGRSWCDSVELPWRVGSESHVYGCEWDANGLKFYADGNLVKDAPESEIGNVWCLDEQMIIWVDSETFAWEGFPDPEDLPADYEIDYIRVWQK